MFKKILLVAAFAFASVLLSENASAQCYGGGGYGYGGYGGPVVAYRGVPAYGYGHHHRGSVYRSGYGGVSAGYGSFYGPGYGRGYGYGGPYYGGSAYGVGRSGFSLRIGF